MAYTFDLYDAMNSHTESLQNKLSTALPATVKTYNASTQSVDVTVDVRLKNNFTGEEDPVTELLEVPLIFPSGGGGILSFPVKAGDKVLLVFSRYSIDRWKIGKDGIAGENRQHSLSDAIAIAGLFNLSSNLQPNPDDVELKAFGTTVTLKASGDVEIVPAGKTIVNSDMDVNGNVNVNGDTTVTGTLKGNTVTQTSNNVTLGTHKHPANNTPPIAGT